MKKTLFKLDKGHLGSSLEGSLKELLGEDSAMELYNNVMLSVVMPEGELLITIEDEFSYEDLQESENEVSGQDILHSLISWAKENRYDLLLFSYRYDASTVKELWHNMRD